MGRVVQMHGELYARQFGYDWTFEALVAEVAAGFVRGFDARCERCWIAEMDGEVVGSIFLVRKSAAVSKLRLLILHPKARGIGLGRRLARACIRFARAAGYRMLTLWTHSQLDAARRIYRRAGFGLARRSPTHAFGRDLVDETWELRLAPPRS